MRAMSFARCAAALAVAAFALPAFADTCPKLANKTMCITATNSSGGSWKMQANFGAYDSVTQDGPATIGGNRGYYRCVGNNFAKIAFEDTTFDTYTWIARVAAKAKSADGTGTIEPSAGYFRFQAVEGACPTVR